MSKKLTKTEKVLRDLQRRRKKGVTSWDMITKHRATRLSAIIFNLRKRGYKIRTEMETKNGSTYARYFLEDE